jgi:hypothetical protein
MEPTASQHGNTDHSSGLLASPDPNGRKCLSEHHEDDITRATARLPGLEIEIVHRRLPGGEGEQISINLEAVPSFEAFGRFLETANPFAFWAHVAQMVWLPWLEVAHPAVAREHRPTPPKLDTGDSQCTPS